MQNETMSLVGAVNRWLSKGLWKGGGRRGYVDEVDGSLWVQNYALIG